MGFPVNQFLKWREEIYEKSPSILASSSHFIVKHFPPSAQTYAQSDIKVSSRSVLAEFIERFIAKRNFRRTETFTLRLDQ